MRTARLHLAAAGSTLLRVGVFLPGVNVPIVGNVNYIRKGTSNGVLTPSPRPVAGESPLKKPIARLEKIR
jgi:hypothetical protein